MTPNTERAYRLIYFYRGHMFINPVYLTDPMLGKFDKAERKDRHFVIDSHPVTKEDYGFRVTGFLQDKVTRLAPDCVICLYATPNVITQRISADPQGRPLPTQYELEIHNQTQIPRPIVQCLGTVARTGDAAQPRCLQPAAPRNPHRRIAWAILMGAILCLIT
jgi:hypothetical protein